MTAISRIPSSKYTGLLFLESVILFVIKLFYKFIDARLLFLHIVTAAEEFFQPAIEDDEKVARTHFSELELGHAASSVAPGDRDGGPSVAADVGFQRQLHQQVEVGRDQRLATVNRGLAIGFEGVGGVVEAVVEQGPDKTVEDPVQDHFVCRIVDGAAALDEAAAEDRVIPFVEKVPVADHVPAIVGFVRHHDHRSITFHRGETVKDGAADAMADGVLHRLELGNLLFELGEDFPSAVAAAVIHHHDLMRHLIEAELKMKVLDGAADAALFVSGGNDHAQEVESF